MKRLGSCTSRRSNKKYGIVDNEEVDRISELPEPILHHILSLLRTKDAPKTSVLSKTWYSAFNSFPVLNFDENDYFNGEFPDDPALGQGFYNYVNHSISRRCHDVSIQRFSLRVFLDNLPRPRPLNSGPTYFDEYLDRFINYALSNNVEHLDLDYYMKNAFAYITQTSALFHPNKSLKVLDLCGFNIVFEEESVGSIIDDQNFISSGYFSSLERLKLFKVRVDEQMLKRFLSNTCSLEDVTILLCQGFRSLSLCSPKLTSVYVHLDHRDEVQEIKIEAPNLRSLTLGKRCIDVLSSILDAASKGYAKKLKELQLYRVPIKDAIFRVIQGFGGELEKLKLKRCVMSRSVRVSSCQLISNSTVKYNDVELIADCRECRKKKEKKGKRSRVENGLYKLKIK